MCEVASLEPFFVGEKDKVCAQEEATAYSVGNIKEIWQKVSYGPANGSSC